MDNAKILIYDGSFNGFLTTIYRAFDENIQVSDIQKNIIFQGGLFSDTETVSTQLEHAKSVWNGIQTKSHIAIRNIYFAFLSEHQRIEIILYNYIKKLFSPKDMLSLNFPNDLESSINQLANTVGKEKQHMEAYLKFNATADGVQLAFINPDNDILPLISRHYRFKFPDSPWLIYDSKRDYGLYYNLKTVELISLDTDVIPKSMEVHELTIKSSIVRKLHRQPMQKRRTAYAQERAAV
ncbi:TIGR03915 family putative DNA repair protein [Maribacter sp.]|nr:TIGR03915 family putative DNA repair protein [Maribacter sp.]